MLAFSIVSAKRAATFAAEAGMMPVCAGYLVRDTNPDLK